MSIRADSSSLITGAVVVGDPGLGVLAEHVPSTGEHGAGYLFPSLEFPAYAGKEVRGLITTWPTLGTLTAFEDSSFEYDGPPDTFAFQMYVNGQPVGTPQTVTTSEVAQASQGGSIRVDSSSLIAGAVVVGGPGLGVLAEVVPSTGEDGAGYLYASLEFPADNGKEVRGLITTWPTLGTLTAFEDSSFEYDGPPDTFAFQMYVDGQPVGTPQTVTFTVGAEIELVIASATSATTSDSATVSQTHALLVADALSATTSEVAQAGQGGQHTVTATDATSATTSDSATVSQTHVLLVADALSATTSEVAQAGQGGQHAVTATESTSATLSETASILQTHRILVSDVVSATLSSTASAGAVSGSPTGLEGTPGQHSITWVWEAVSGAAGYEIEYGPVGGPHVRADTGSVTSFEQTGLSGNTPYEARVRSYV